MEQLKNFLINTLIMVSIISLSVFVISSSLMLDGIIPMINDWGIWFVLIVPFNFAIIMIWSYRVMVIRKSYFLPVFKEVTQK